MNDINTTTVSGTATVTVPTQLMGRCPGCGRCQVCGRPAEATPQIAWGPYTTPYTPMTTGTFTNDRPWVDPS